MRGREVRGVGRAAVIAIAATAALALGACQWLAGIHDPEKCAGKSACSLIGGTACPGGETCVWNGDCGEAYCRASAGSGAVGKACDVATDCAAGLDCVLHVCRRYCNDDAQCTDVNSKCRADYTPLTNAITCGDACTPVSNAGCPPGDTCLIVQGADTATCLPGGGDLPAGADCSGNVFRCQVGEVCYGAGATHVCRVECDPANPGTICGSMTCMQTGDLTIGGTQYGVCM